MNLRTLIKNKTPLFIDGAMGTMLQALGMPKGTNPAEFCMERTDIVEKIHLEYLKAGANIVITSTFGGTKYKLPAHLSVEEFNEKMALTARRAVNQAKQLSEIPYFVAGDIGPVGKFLRPLGELDPNDFISAIREQVRGLIKGGVDLIFIETQFDLAEVRAAVAAARMETDLPIFASMTFEDGVSLTGSSPEIFAATMQNMGIDAIGVNCGAGPEQMLPVIKRILASCTLPVFVEPNAGLPELIDGETVFRLAPQEFAEKTGEIAKEGVYILGGCCGTSPEHIKALCDKVLSLVINEQKRKVRSGIRLTSRSSLVHIGRSQALTMIGERINPTGKKALTAELQAGKFDLALQYADEQIAMGTRILDVNVGAPHVHEESMLPSLVETLVSRVQTPLCIDSSNPDAIIAALPFHPGSALVNSISGEEGKMERLAPICRIWGSPFILLPLTGAQLPKSSSERITIIEKLLLKAEQFNIPRHLIMVDILALTAASDSNAPKACLETVKWCDSQHLPTTLGLSNISFGLPARDLVNSSFFAMAAGSGLTSCIANPSNIRIREALDSANLLLDHDSNAENFTTNYAKWTSQNQNQAQTANQVKVGATTAEEAVILGDKDHIIKMIDEELAKGADPFKLVRERLIPAIQEVGILYEKKEYFLPQLLRSASTMQEAFAHIKPLLEENGQNTDKQKIILATVQGDIHDIGKNIVGLLLSNHGYEVIDLGKDVPAEIIVKKAMEENVQLIGLSALMTTTMPRMEETIKLIQEKNLSCKVMIGGAVVTKEYAQSIHAHGFALDAVEAVRVAKELLGN